MGEKKNPLQKMKFNFIEAKMPCQEVFACKLKAFPIQKV